MTNNTSKHILLIEDDLFIRELYERTLTQDGFTVSTGIDGEEGGAKAISEKPDLILLDIMMPKKNGIDVLKDLKASNTTKNIPVFLLTNLGQESIIKEAFSMGAAGYLLKARLLPRDVCAHIVAFFETGVVPTELTQL
ncbi:response regulator [candidate division WWE3 bacterium CG_4_10_14_0_2_um_filter_41_14]|uniref:Response regulator n=1 Tax=candidate division WWE3 bacterium CG_4_10_14_0_2_um_filter_41_14 TaxID=1975072 RepID=A0A2M7TKS8_UNCKA|nr:MAG: response regulator [candidate division WWE3 bacterium CG_4_10_14_0_2_um_filter_41_14]